MDHKLSDDIVVYTEYDAAPPHPGHEWTRIICISDTHSRPLRVPLGDVLLHAGDLTAWGYPEQLQAIAAWLQTLPHPFKIVIGGNHDLGLDPEITESLFPNDQDVQETCNLYKSDAMHEKGVYYLEHDFLRLKLPSGRTWTIYGSPVGVEIANKGARAE
ncbi:metallophosphoesterase domain-containing protein 1 [Coprinopsis cinerea AmutBmut pab1-1]|nr:metallophosphoesterase domain-containing protein 1 [Coprinopsis cinerea AmutBmut pab1-1]